MGEKWGRDGLKERIREVLFPSLLLGDDNMGLMNAWSFCLAIANRKSKGPIKEREELCSLLFRYKQKRRRDKAPKLLTRAQHGHIILFSRMAKQRMHNHITCLKNMPLHIPSHPFPRHDSWERDPQVHCFPPALNCYFMCIAYIIFFKSASKNELLHVATQHILKPPKNLQ